ncbi:hypothetical protein ACH3VR_18820 [Microbacterium sp. B2969]|uniref:DUF1707 domain-containing protein n=1 Tax=Microbacterium alkaliflavum TaxID=3248839 RepID=A0ABW7QE24_9MICO
MSVFSRFRHDKAPPVEVTEEERLARYAHLLEALPGGVIEKAHAAAFKALTADQRAALAERLQASIPDADRDAASDDPKLLAALFARTVDRGAGTRIDPAEVLRDAGAVHAVVPRVVSGEVVTTYYLFGPGSQTIDQEPAWLRDMVASEGAALSGDHVRRGPDANQYDPFHDDPTDIVIETGTWDGWRGIDPPGFS